MLVSLHRPAAAGTAVANSIESPEHSILVVVGTINQIHSPSWLGWWSLGHHGGEKAMGLGSIERKDEQKNCQISNHSYF
jgi:hypothetical protein